MVPGNLLIKTVCISPPVLSCSPWPSEVNVIIQAGISAQSVTSSGALSSSLEANVALLASLQGPWLLSSVSSSGGKHESVVVPSCIHPEHSGIVIINFKGLEVEAVAPGVISLALCPAVSEQAAAAGTCVVEPAPLFITSSAAAAAELTSLFGTMKRLVAEEQHVHTQQVLSGATADWFADWASGLDNDHDDDNAAVCAVHSRWSVPPGSSTPCGQCNMGASAAAEQALLCTAWHDNFLLLLLDIQSVLACAISISNSSSGVQMATDCSAAACVPALPCLQNASKMLVGVVKYLALHGCWSCVSYLLAEAFKSGLLACTGALLVHQLSDQHTEGHIPGAADTAAATAASLILSLASTNAPAGDLKHVLAAVQPMPLHYSSANSSDGMPAAVAGEVRGVPTKPVYAQDSQPLSGAAFEAAYTKDSTNCRSLCSASSTAFLLLVAALPFVTIKLAGLANAAHVGTCSIHMLVHCTHQPLVSAGLSMAASLCSTLLPVLVFGIACGSLCHHCRLHP